MTMEERTQDQIITELYDLHKALIYSRLHDNISCHLTVGERICVNQERAVLFRILDGVPKAFVQSPQVQEKITRILYLIDRTDWQPPHE